MELFKTFSFDAIIILVLVISFFVGIYYGIYRQVGLVLKLGLPFIALYFVFNGLMNIYLKTTRLGLFKKSANRYLFNALLVYILAYVLLFSLTGFIYYLFRPSVKKRVLTQSNIYLRIVGGFIGLISGFLICTILAYFIKPFINYNYDNPLTKALIASENKVLTISKLNQYQNINVERFEEYKETIDLFTGRRALDFYSLFEQKLTSLPELELKLKTEIQPLLSENSKNLITSNDILKELIRKDGNKRVYEKIMEAEKENSNFALIEETLLEINNNRAFIWVYYEYLGTDISELSFNGLVSFSQNNLDAMLLELPDHKSRLDFKEDLAACEYYLDHGQVFSGYLSAELEANDLKTYVTTFENLLKAEALQDYSERFLKTESAKYPKLAKIFKNYQKNIKVINNLPNNLSFVVKLVLAEEEKNWFQNPLWEKHTLLKYYLYDALSAQSNRGHELYSEYFFANYLAVSEDYEVFGVREFEECLERLDETVKSGLLRQEVAEKFVTNLLLDEESIIADMERRNITSASFYEDILALEHEYLTDSLKAELLKR